MTNGLLHRVKLAVHVLRGRPLIYRVPLDGGIRVAAAVRNLTISNNTVHQPERIVHLSDLKAG